MSKWISRHPAIFSALLAAVLFFVGVTLTDVLFAPDSYWYGMYAPILLGLTFIILCVGQLKGAQHAAAASKKGLYRLHVLAAVLCFLVVDIIIVAMFALHARGA